MMLLDSNVIIYASQPEHAALRELIAEQSPYVSAISYVEVLGYYNLTLEERKFFEQFFQSADVLAISDPVLVEAVKLRQLRKMTLGDALIAATTLVHGLTLVTRNQKDFEWIPNLSILNPVDTS
jgi:predicted nucleic acid-binding protein